MIEHVRKIWVWIKEVARVTRVGGIIIIINPVTHGYHEWPVDCWRIYPEGIRALFEEANVECLSSIHENLDKNKKTIDTISIGKKRE